MSVIKPRMIFKFIPVLGWFVLFLLMCWPTGTSESIALLSVSSRNHEISQLENHAHVKTGVLDWSTAAPGVESVRLVQSCSTHAQYGNYRADAADDIASSGVDTIVYSRVTGTQVVSRWSKDTFLRENGRVIVDDVSTFSWARHRQLAWGIVKSTKLGLLSSLHGFQVESLADLAKTNNDIKIWNTQSESTIHEALKSLTGYVGSEYFPDAGLQSGDFVLTSSKGRVRHEDLTKPSFTADSLDLIISSEVFEHIPTPYVAHQRVYEILKPGGVHVFTVPFNEQLSDVTFASLDQNGKVHFKGEPMMHGDPLRPEGVPVFTIFGQEMITRLCDIGFDTYAYMIHVPREGILGSGALVFIAAKVDPGGNPGVRTS